MELQPVKTNDILLNRYKLEEDIGGTGGFSQVFRIKDLKTCQNFAMKISGGGTLPSNSDDDEFTNVEIAIREIRTIKKLAKCSGKGKLLCALMTDWHYLENRVAILFPCYASSINDLMDSLDRRPFIWKDVIAISFQLVHVTEFLHENRITHMDIKPHNLMLICADYQLITIEDSVQNDCGELEDFSQECISLRNPEIKLIDFGSCLSYEDRGKNYFIGVTDQYRSPESLLQMKTTPAYDIWSVGCTIVELYAGCPLFPSCSADVHLMLIQKIIGEIPERFKLRSKLPEMTKEMTEIGDDYCPLSELISWGDKDRVYLYDLLSVHLLKIDPEERTALAQILDHEFFANTPNFIRRNMEASEFEVGTF